MTVIYDYWQIRDAEDRCKSLEDFEKGKEEGIEEGIERGKLAVAYKLIAKGMSAEEAAEVAGIAVGILQSGD